MLKTCLSCRASFDIAPEDFEFYSKISPRFQDVRCEIPPPSYCPECRQLRRLVFRNERNLYTDSCDLCKKSIVSLYSPDKKFRVYCQECWWSDGWDPLALGLPYDSSRPFFEQLRELQFRVPRLAIFNMHSENSTYTNHSVSNKNCYMGVAVGNSEDCHYGHWVLNSKNTLDGLYLDHCEQCYECSYCEHCFQARFCAYCESVSDSALCFECKGCSNCLGCVQQQRKSYCILNQQSDKATVERTLIEILSSRAKFDEFFAEYRKLQLRAPRKASHQLHCEASTGDDIHSCKNALESYNCRELEDCKHMYDLGNNRTSMDCYEHGWLVPSELNYQCHAGMSGYHLLFCNLCSESRDLICCDLCVRNCRNNFGCIALKGREHCILNQQYSEAEYHSLVPKIIRSLSETGDWGEFFPPSLSMFGYNESPAQEYFLRDRAQALGAGYQWCDFEAPRPAAKDVLRGSELPERITDVQDDIVQRAIGCEATGKLFRIISPELSFYRLHGLPVPRKHPDERHRLRMALRNPRKLIARRCEKCGEQITSTFSLERPELVYCDRCYTEAVY